MINIRVASKEEGLLKAFLFVSWWKTDDMTVGEGGGEGMGKNEVSRSFSGWLSDIITAGPSLVVFSLVPFPHSPFYLAGPVSFSLSLSLFRFFLFSSTRRPPLLASLVFRLTALSLSVPAGLRGQRGEISDQFFKPRVPRLYTSWETTLGWAPVRLQTFAATRVGGGGRYFGLVSRPGVRVKSSREEN